jgi:colanic acid/amylovoran biosynthesis protein
VLVRDEPSLALLRLGSGCCDHAAVAPDVALLFAGDKPAAGRALLARWGVDANAPAPRLGMTLVNWGAQNRRFAGQAEYEAAMAAAARAFVEQQGGTAVLFPQVTGPSAGEDDRIPARRVKALLADLGERVALVDEPVEPGVLKSAYGQMALFLGTRLHSNLFALTAGTPVVAVAYQTKTHGVMGMAGLGEWVIDIERARGAAVAQMVAAAWAQRDTLRAHLRAVLPGLEQEAARALDKIREDYAYLLEARASALGAGEEG